MKFVLAALGVIGAIILVVIFINSSSNPKETKMTNETSTPSSDQSLPQNKKQYDKFPGVTENFSGKKVVIATEKGEIVIEILPDAPKAASNFLFLVKEGFYDELTFHRREEGFVIQGGDPSGNGTGGPGYKFEDEPVTKNYDRGIVAMANSGPDTNGSQFFIMLKDTNLPKNYTIFGKVISGMDVVDKIQVGDVMNKLSIT